MIDLNKCLDSMEERELISEVLKLRKVITDLKNTEAYASQIHNYHFASAELIKLTEARFIGSGFILSINSLKGKPIITPITICDGFKNETIDCLLDEMQKTFDLKTSFKPITKRLTKGKGIAF